LPVGGGLCVSDAQKFLKRVRITALRRFGPALDNSVSSPSPPLRYFLCGEYGGQGRPHYHAVMMSRWEYLDTILHDCWGKGRTDIDFVCRERIDYVTRYVQKKLSGDLADAVYGTRDAPFQLQSLGMGLRAAHRDKDQLIRFGKTRDGKPVAIPKYYVTKLGLEDHMKHEAALHEVRVRSDHARVLADDLVPERALMLALTEEREQRARNIAARLDRFKSKDDF